jgi:hypothetical protein
MGFFSFPSERLVYRWIFIIPSSMTSSLEVTDGASRYDLTHTIPSSAQHRSSFLLSLSDSEPVLEEVLRNPGLCSAFKSHDPSLIQYFDDTTIFWRLMDLFHKSTDPIILSAIASLFLSPNPLFITRCSSHSDVIEFFGQILFSPTSDLSLAFLSQIIAAAAHKLGTAFFHVLYNSPTFFPLLLSRIDRSAIHEACAGLSQSMTASDHSFLWGYHLAVLPDHAARGPPPSLWRVDFQGVMDCAEVPLSPLHRIQILKLFTSFVQSFPDEAAFGNAVSDALEQILSALETDDELTAVLGLSMIFPKKDCVSKLALSVLARAPLIATPVLETALEYVIANFETCELEPAIVFIYTVLDGQITNTFLWMHIIELVVVMARDRDAWACLLPAMQHLIAHAWNHKGNDCSLVKRSFLLKLADNCADKPSFPGWVAFVQAVIEPYRFRTTFPRNFQIPEEGMDPAIADVLTGSLNLKALLIGSTALRPHSIRFSKSTPIKISRSLSRAPGRLTSRSGSLFRETQPSEAKKRCQVE